jgi:hypothetical protein
MLRVAMSDRKLGVIIDDLPLRLSRAERAFGAAVLGYIPEYQHHALVSFRARPQRAPQNRQSPASCHPSIKAVIRRSGARQRVMQLSHAIFLIALVTCLKLMSNRENENDIFVWYPAILGQVAEPTARQDQLPAPFLGFPTQQRMVRKQLEGPPNADHPLMRNLRIVFREKAEKPLEIGERSGRYLDARHARSRGRRADFPATRASR